MTSTYEFDNISVRELPGNHATQTTTTSRPVLSARVNLLTATETLATQTVTTRATTQTLRFEGAGTVTLSGTATGTYSAGSHSITTTAGNLTLTVSGTVTKADLRATNMGVGLPAYQRVNTSTDYDTAGFPHYLRFDQTDDALSAAGFSLTGTDKVTVGAAICKQSDSAQGIVVELGAGTDTNRIALSAPGSAAANYAFTTGGTTSVTATTGNSFAAPRTEVLTGIGDIASDTALLRVNGVQQAASASDQGTGTYMSGTLFIGRRNNASLPFGGRLYGLIVMGASNTAAQTAAMERYLAGKAGVSL